MHWLATPDVERAGVLTHGAFAKLVGRAEPTLSEWKRLPGFQDEVNALVRQAMADAYPEVVQALKREAAKGNFPHLKLYFEMTGEYAPKQTIEHDGALRVEVVYVDDDHSNPDQ